MLTSLVCEDRDSFNVIRFFNVIANQCETRLFPHKLVVHISIG